MLYEIQARFGGAVSRYSDQNGKAISAFRWVLGERAGMRRLLVALNGKLFIERKYLQFSASCAIFGILPQRLIPCRSTSWLAGFFDADGHVSIPRLCEGVNIRISQKGPGLEVIASVWGGAVYHESRTGDCHE